MCSLIHLHMKWPVPSEELAACTNLQKCATTSMTATDIWCVPLSTDPLLHKIPCAADSSDVEGPGLPAGDEVLVAIIQLHKGLHNLGMHPVNLLVCGVVALLHCEHQNRDQRSRCAAAKFLLHV